MMTKRYEKRESAEYSKTCEKMDNETNRQEERSMIALLCDKRKPWRKKKKKFKSVAKSQINQSKLNKNNNNHIKCQQV